MPPESSHTLVSQIATGEHGQNRMIFKQLLQAESIDVCQIDSCRLAGINEILAVLLMSAKAGVPVCPHAGGVGLCEMVIHRELLLLFFRIENLSLPEKISNSLDYRLSLRLRILQPKCSRVRRSPPRAFPLPLLDQLARILQCKFFLSLFPSKSPLTLTIAR